jgi:hypothetical protein
MGKIDYGFKADRLHQEFGKWLQSYDWDVWGTAEFDPQKPLRDALRARGYVEKYIKNNLCRPRLPLSYFLAVERFSHSMNTHVHFLLAGVLGLTYEEMGAPWWKKYHGYFYVEKYEPNLGAGFYLTKYVTKDLCDWNVSLKDEHLKEYSLFYGIEVVTT